MDINDLSIKPSFLSKKEYHLGILNSSVLLLSDEVIGQKIGQ